REPERLHRQLRGSPGLGGLRPRLRRERSHRGRRLHGAERHRWAGLAGRGAGGFAVALRGGGGGASLGGGGPGGEAFGSGAGRLAPEHPGRVAGRGPLPGLRLRLGRGRPGGRGHARPRIPPPGGRRPRPPDGRLPPGGWPAVTAFQSASAEQAPSAAAAAQATAAQAGRAAPATRTGAQSELAASLSRLRRRAQLVVTQRWLAAAGGVMIPLGAVLIIAGWYGSAHTTLPWEPTPYII